MVKCAAVAITFGGRMGGGVFSPSLMLGALTGRPSARWRPGLLPEASGSVGLYALAGHGRGRRGGAGRADLDHPDRVRADRRLSGRHRGHDLGLAGDGGRAPLRAQELLPDPARARPG
jgi:hypothetical protein